MSSLNHQKVFYFFRTQAQASVKERAHLFPFARARVPKDITHKDSEGISPRVTLKTPAKKNPENRDFINNQY